MRDEHHRVAGVGKPSHPRQQVGGFTGREDRRGFIENQQSDIARERLHDFAALLRAHRQRVHARLRVEREAGARRHRVHARFRLRAVEATGAAQCDVLRHRHGGDQREVLMHHADARAQRLRRRGDGERRAVPQHPPTVGSEQPEHHAHQRGFSRAIFAKQSVYRARSHGEGCVLQRLHRAEAPRDALELEQRGG